MGMKLFSSKYYKIYAVVFLAAHLSFLAGGALHTHAYYNSAKTTKTAQNDPLSSSSSECYFHFAASSIHQMDNSFHPCDRLILSGENLIEYKNPFALLNVEHTPFTFRAPPSASR